jgi:iron complex outermembrane receptor protein
MMKNTYSGLAIALGLGILLSATAFAENFNIPGGDLKSALDSYAKQAGVALMYSAGAVKSVQTKGARGALSPEDALSRILNGTGFISHPEMGAIAIIHDSSAEADETQIREAAANAPTAPGASLETVTVTSSKIGGDVQNIPIAITAMSQEQLTATQTTGGPDLVKQIPNFNFSKTNFSGYNIQIRGIGTQAVSVTTDPAVAVAFNDMAFLRNHFFEQEFFDVSQVEVLRGPQGTLYGRNATAGVVNIVSAKASNQYEALASVDVGNYENRRFEGMLNIPVVGDKLDLRLAGEWTKRDGYDFNITTGHSVNGRDLWSGRATVGFHPFEKLTGELVWEHFSEDDDRSRTGKQLCTRDPGPSSLPGLGPISLLASASMSQGCLPGSLYSPAAFGTPNGLAIPFIFAAAQLGPNSLGQIGYNCNADFSTCTNVPLVYGDPYGGRMQSPNLRVIASIKDPKFRAKNDVLELNADYNVTPSLTFTSQTGYNKDFYYSTQDYNRFDTVPVFNNSDLLYNENGPSVNNGQGTLLGVPALPITPGGVFCDPQLGCSSSIAGFDISQAKSWQFNQEVRLASNYDGPVNFSAGANYTHYRTVEDYYVLFNVLTALTEAPGFLIGNNSVDPTLCGQVNGGTINPPVPIGSPAAAGCIYIDPNPIDKINGQGHNYFRSDNPYTLNSYAGFGEVYYQVMPDVKLTAGLRYTDDNKDFTPVPSQTLLSSSFFLSGTVDRGYPALPDINQHWGEFSGRLVANWTPKLAFTDQSMFYTSYSHGYKGGGANPPGIGYNTTPVFNGKPFTEALPYPPLFKPEFVNAYEIGTKNTLLDGRLTLNGDVFFYDYRNYQISQIKSRTAVNENFNAKVWGSEAEATWEPVPGLRFNFAGGYEGSRVDSNQFSLDEMDVIQGHTDYTIMKPWPQLPDNCVVLKSVVEQYILLDRQQGRQDDDSVLPAICPGTFLNLFRPIPIPDSAFPNGGLGFLKNVGGNQLPNTPPFTLSLGAQYSMPLSSDWAATLRGDGYWQGNSFARIYNDKPYDQIHGYTNLNLTLIFTDQDGWQAMAYVKNVFDTTAITGTFLNSPDTALTTNIFTTDPRLFGLRLTKNW